MQHSKPSLPYQNPIEVGEIVQSTVDSRRSQFQESSINVELDLEEVETKIDRELVRKTTQLLLDNASEKMLAGGTISITLIDGEHQWELEVADSNGMAYQPFGHTDDQNPVLKSRQNRAESLNEAEDLPVVIEFPSTDALRDAYRTAAQHGGQIQTWDCPQGGTAHVWVVPKREHRNNRYTV